MGTDIHLYVEAKVEGRWRLVAPPRELLSTWRKDTPCYGCKYPGDYGGGFGRFKCLQCLDTGVDVAAWYDERHYVLFAALANVRNGSGFAGVYTHEPIVPIAEPRGLPEDISPEMAEVANRRLEHTPTWLTVAEVEAYDWQQPIHRKGWLDGATWKKWMEAGGAPDNWCGGVSGSAIRHVDSAEMAATVKRGDTDEMNRTYTQASWTSKLAEEVDDFLKLLPRWRALGETRLVMWFDS